ncbi:MAG: DNA-processing protein DprA [Gemmatimonadaceae bacterium]
MRRIEMGDEGYPPALLDLRSPPRVLWAIGDLRMLEPPVVAIVGTRKATAYGERVTREVAGALARAGVSIVSGMARGIDGTAHLAALDAGGRTVAVLGTGVDVAYPAGHRPLHIRIRKHGLLLSEEDPGAHAGPGSFPKRNRLIAALASITIVVEAGAPSGAGITAELALELGRTVAAVPGPIDAPQSRGTNNLIRDGATVIADVADALQLAGVTPPVRHPDPEIATAAEHAVWSALRDGALDVDALAMRSGLPARECLAAVTTLELSGAIECALTGEIRRRL